MQAASQKNLFKFMAVRPVQMTDPSGTEVRFLRSPAEGSEFSKSLGRAKTWKDAKSLATTYLSSNAYPGEWGESDATILFLRQVYSLLQLGAATGDLESLRKAWKVLQPQAKTLKLSETRVRLWDTLVAAYVAPRVKLRDRGEIINSLRALQLIEVIDTLKNAAGLTKLLRATALIPSWVSRKKLGGAVTEGEPTKVPTNETVLKQVNGLRREVVAIDDAIEDLELVRKQSALDRIPAAPTVTLGRGTGTPSNPGSGVILMEDRKPVPSTANQISSKLKPSTASYLDTLDRGWKLKSAEGVVDDLESKRSKVVDDLEVKGGRDASAGVRSRTAQPTRLTPDLLDTKLDLTAVTPVTNFEKSIAGSVGTVRPLGVGDLLVVEEKLLAYQEGEISHIENVMATERRDRTHRQLDRVSTTTMSSTETTEETERDLQTSQRNEVASEVQETIRNNVGISTGVNVSGGFGPVVQVDTSADFAVNHSTENSTTNSSNFAQEVVDSTVSKLTQNIKEQITQKVLTETEETNKHGFENNTPNHVIGIYRWLEKLYQAQIFNYGKRLMMEVVVPEPSAFYKFARDGGAVKNMTMEPPKPLPKDFGFQELTPQGYRKWVDLYHVKGVNPPPDKSIVIGKVIEVPETRHDLKASDYSLTTKSDSIDVPEGYRATQTWVRGAWVVYSDQKENPQISGTKLMVVVGQETVNKMTGEYTATLANEERLVPIGIVAYNIAAYTINVEILCERKDKTLEAWQLETYKKIVEAYEAQQAAYNAQLESKRVAQSAGLTAISPTAKRGIEQTELKKACLELLTGQYFYDFDATADEANPFGYPEFRVAEAMEESVYSQFFEQCFEWAQLTYQFYPYFWGRKSQWVANSTESDDDPIFESFLRSGSARALLPVRPGYVKAVLYYLDTGEIWNGGEAPALDEELQVSIAEENAEAQDLSSSQRRPYGKPWTYTLPTSLIKLQADATLPSWTTQAP